MSTQTVLPHRDKPGHLLRSARLKQIRCLGDFLVILSRLHAGASFVRLARRWSVTRTFLKYSLGYKWAFESLSEAKAAATRFIPSSHEHIDNAWTHLNFVQAARPSDYPVLFHWTKSMSTCRAVFDLGGNVGNLFYCYHKYVNFPSNLVWTVCDLPEICDIGNNIARGKDEHRIRFATTLEALAGADVLIASGSLHYFDLPLPGLIAQSPSRPKHVLINRTPLTDAKSIATVQDAGSYLVACQLYNRTDLLTQFVTCGYDVVDSWTIPELSVRIPCYPELSVPAYSGYYLRLK